MGWLLRTMVERLTPEEVRFFKTEGYLIKPAARAPVLPRPRGPFSSTHRRATAPH